MTTIDDRFLNQLLGNPEIGEEKLGINNLLKDLDAPKNHSRKQTATPQEVVRMYLSKRNFKEIENGKYSDFTAVDPHDETLGDIVPCDVLVYYLEIENEDEADAFEITPEQMTKMRKAVAFHLVDHPDCLDCRVDIILLIHLDGEQLMLQHQMGLARLLFLSKDSEEE